MKEEKTKKEPEKETSSTDNNNPKTDLEHYKNELASWKDKCLRISADFENFKKRVDKEKEVWTTAAKTKVIADLLVIIDDFDRALAQEDINNEGFKLIQTSFLKLLKKYGVSQMTEYAVFNPELHEALVQVDSEEHKSGEIIQVMQQGFMINGRVLRPAKVSVAK